ncbi:YhgE/Pip domain-containing protein [Mesobacillus subterraneus]|uniref:YhgE/Pip domain-containing protein n=1 Tax=Mesobacillus subterraneus TaxID=285983 RepID=A0A3R9F4I9_9BACI|nr:YhgE/Pip domain-containing protein [Mesobacillus subterraneus]RSD28858.1 YhgE/Pip domain-containing protein [Mesobacillus subterraneus]
MMMRTKPLLYVTLAFMSFLPSFLSYTVEAETVKKEGKLTSKDEVVYATLKANGDLDSIYVVNTLDVEQAGEILDYGEYSNLKNLTDLAEISQEDQTVRLEAPEGKFYYQGNLEDSELPWNLSISYSLNGRKIQPAELAGQKGHLEISIETGANKNVDPAFYENYLLQISLMLSNSYQNIEASGGMVANAGKNKQVTFTVMPAQEERLSVEADVEDFEFNGIDIAAVPSTLPIDTSEMENMTEDMSTLSDAIGELHSGVTELRNGVSRLNNGAAALSDGSGKYKNGIGQMNGAGSDLVGASRSIGDALKKISTSLSGGADQTDMSSLSELPKGLTQIAAGLEETSNGLATLRKNYSQAYGALDGAIKEIPAAQLTETDIAGLYNSNADQRVVKSLVESYTAAQKVKGTYDQVKQAFAAVDPALKQSEDALRNMSAALTSIANEVSGSLENIDAGGIAELQKGMAALSSNYGEFHSGLVKYTDGVSQLSSSYTQLHSGIAELSGGTNKLATGVNELHNGTNELHQETKDLPEQMQNEINEMIQEYDKSDFEPVSFVSSKNEKVKTVQFVIKTESIQLEEQKTKKAVPVKEKGFWDLLMDLFK